MKFLQIKETCLYVSDLDKTREFYHGKLGLEIYSHIPGSHVFFRAGSSMLLCFLNEAVKEKTSLPAHFATGQIHFAFEIDQQEYENCKARLIDKGIVIEHEHTWKNNIKSFYFRDPDNNLAEVLQPGMWD